MMNEHDLAQARQQRRRPAFGVAMTLLLCSCMQMPMGPSVAVMPAPNKPFDVFIADDRLCRDWAAWSIGTPGHDVAAQQMLASTLAGAAIGTVAGTLAGGNRAAGTGAAVGTVFGASAGANFPFHRRVVAYITLTVLPMNSTGPLGLPVGEPFSGSSVISNS
jgi:hypothetical protein